MRVIALINQKGGVGKTTTTVNLGAGLARQGKKVLAIDIDPQANLSLHLNINVFESGKSVYDLLVGRCPLKDVARETEIPNLQVVPSSIDLCSAELELVNTVGREVLLRDALYQFIDSLDEPLDYVLIDCPPSLGLLSLNALAAAQEVFVPIQAEFFALQGMGKLMEVVELVRNRLNPVLKVTGIVVCMFRAQTNLAREVLSEVRAFFGDVVFETRIRQNINLAEAPSHGKSIFDYAIHSNGAQDYLALTDEILAQESGRTREKTAAESEKSTESVAPVEESSPEKNPDDPGTADIIGRNHDVGARRFAVEIEEKERALEDGA